MDLVQAIRNLGLNVVRASVDSTPGDDRAVYQFFVTGAWCRLPHMLRAGVPRVKAAVRCLTADKYTSDKVLKSEMLEEIRVAIAYSLLQSVDDLEGKIMAAARPAPAEEGKPVARNKDGIATKVWIYRHVTGSRSILRVRTWVRRTRALLQMSADGQGHLRLRSSAWRRWHEQRSLRVPGPIPCMPGAVARCRTAPASWWRLCGRSRT